MPDPTHKPPRERSQLLFGLVLLVIGAVLLADNLGFYIPVTLWKLWPIPIMAFGVIGLVLPSRHLDRRGGMWLLAVGLYGAIGTFDWFGLGWNAWPLFLIAAGLNIIFFERRSSRRDRDPPQVKHET